METTHALCQRKSTANSLAAHNIPARHQTAAVAVTAAGVSVTATAAEVPGAESAAKTIAVGNSSSCRRQQSEVAAATTAAAAATVAAAVTAAAVITPDNDRMQMT